MSTPVTQPARTKVLLVDDHDLIRRGLRHAFERDRQFEVVGEAATAAEGIAAARAHHPDIVIMDVRLPDRSGVEALREVPADSLDDLQLGARVDASMFAQGEIVDVIGTSKGKGFAGVMKRHNFRGGPKTHGQSDRWRAPGSIGSGTTPGRVMKGMRMAGHLGDSRVTVQNLEVIRVDPERNLVALRGAVPGPRGGLLMIKKRQVEL
jgi:50S ribosomal protein uL3